MGELVMRLENALFLQENPVKLFLIKFAIFFALHMLAESTRFLARSVS